MSAPQRYKSVAEYSPDEHAQRQQALRRDESEPKFETPEYKEARRKALEKAGLADEADE